MIGFCSKCGNIINQGQKHCSKCGNRIQEKSEAHTASQNAFEMYGNKYFVLEEYNWSCHSRDSKACQTWVVFQDGKVCSTAKYGSGRITEVKYARLGKLKFHNLCVLCKKLVQSDPKGHMCYDGMGYKILIYNTDGSEKYCYHGYIYGNKLLESIRNLICNITGLYFSDYDCLF